MFPLWLVIFIPLAASDIIPYNERCVTAVYTAYNYISFTGSPDVGFWDTRCQNPLKVTSIYAASQTYCSPLEQFYGFNQLESYCREFGGLDLLSRDAVIDNLTDDAVSRMRVVEYLELDRREAVNGSVLISRDYYDRVFRTIDVYQDIIWAQIASGYAIYGFWVVVIAIGIVHRLAYHLLHARRPSSPIFRPFQSLYRWIQTHLLISAPVPSNGRDFLLSTLPTRIDAVVIFLYYALNILLCCFYYPVFQGNLYWPEISDQLLRYAADRTGILSFANIPLVWLFAGRNNIFCWATGWSFASFNIFHRHVSRVCTIQAVVHTLLYLVMFYKRGNMWKKMQKPYLLWGTLAMAAMILLLVLSLDRIRQRTYEIFLILHIVFSIVTLVACFYHTIIFQAHDYWIYLWPAVTFWAADRILRLVRLIYCNMHVKHARKIHHTTSIATYDPAADIVRLEVTPGSLSLQPTPGQYYFLYQPFRLTGWESHPFTLGAWSYETSSGAGAFSNSSSKSIDISQLPLLSDDSSSSPSESEAKEPLNNLHLKLIFYIRPFDGWTRHLRSQCLSSNSPNKSTNTTILLEGPYGEHFPLWKYESVLLIAGGTGIAASIPYIQDHLLRSAIGGSEDSGSDGSVIRDIRLVWTTRQAAFIYDLAGRELKQALGREDFRAEFYATKPVPQDTAINAGDAGTEARSGRPDLYATIRDHASAARLSDSSAVVLMCGPPAMADETREAVHRTLREGHSITYVEESSTW